MRPRMGTMADEAQEMADEAQEMVEDAVKEVAKAERKKLSHGAIVSCSPSGLCWVRNVC